MNPLAIFGGPYAMLAKWGVIALLVASFGGWCWFKGNEHGTEKLTDYIGKQAVEAVRINTARTIVTEKIVTKYVRVAAQTEDVAKTIEEEVKKYAAKNRTFTLDPEWRSLHDRAALNAVSAAPGETDAPGGTPPSAAQALATVSANYAACHRTADRLDGLQDWVRAQAGVK